LKKTCEEKELQLVYKALRLKSLPIRTFGVNYVNKQYFGINLNHEVRVSLTCQRTNQCQTRNQTLLS